MHVKELDSIGLIKLCAADTSNDTAWEEFYGRFSEKIKTYLLASCRSARGESPALASQISGIPQQVVDDLAQQFWLRLTARHCRLLKQFADRGEAAFCANLAILSRSLAQNHYRDQRREKRPQIQDSLDDYTTAGNGPEPITPTSMDGEASLYARERIAQLHQIVRALYSTPEEADRAVTIFTLYFCQGYTEAEIARYDGIAVSQPTVSRIILTLKRAVNSLSDRITGSG